MIPMSCPSCGRRGNVPLDRLNTRMHCKKCDAVFHLDATGKPVLGEPAPAKGSKAAKAAGRAKDEPLDPIGIIAEKLSHTPKPIWMGMLVLLGGWVLWTAYGFIGSAPLSVSQNLSKEAMAATTAFLNRDLSKLKDMTASGTEADIEKAVTDFRPLIGDGGSGTDGVMIAPGEPISEDDGRQKIEVSLIAMSGPSFNLHFAWIKNEKGRWFIDGTTSYALMENEAANRKAHAPAKK